MAWGPLDEGKHGIFKDPLLTEIGAKYGKTAAPVLYAIIVIIVFRKLFMDKEEREACELRTVHKKNMFALIEQTSFF